MDFAQIVGFIGTLITFEEAARSWLPIIKNRMAKKKVNLCNWDSKDPTVQ